MQPSERNPITGPEQRRIMTTTASDIGIFSGKEKKRLELSNDELDPTHKFAIALFEEAVNTTDPNHKMDKKGVYVHLRKNDKGVLMTDVADISSIAKRLGLSEDEVRESANKKIGDHTKLDETIQKIVNDYEKEMKSVKEFIVELESLSQNVRKVYNPEAWKQFKGKLNDIGNVNSPLRECVVDNGEVQKLLSDFYEDSSNFYEDSSKSLEKNLNMIEFQGKLAEFQAKLIKHDPNFSPNVEIPREKVTEGSELLKAIPKLSINKIPPKVRKYPDYTPEGAVRLNIAKHSDINNPYAIKTDGYIYHTQPEKTGKFLPYSIDDKTWVLLNVNSLFARTGLTLKELEGQSFDIVINNTMDNLKRVKELSEEDKNLFNEIVKFPGLSFHFPKTAKIAKQHPTSKVNDEDDRGLVVPLEFAPRLIDSFRKEFSELGDEKLKQLKEINTWGQWTKDNPNEFKALKAMFNPAEQIEDVNISDEKQQLDDLVKDFQTRVRFNSEGVQKSIICNEINKSIYLCPYKDFDSFLDRFKELSNEDLVKELSILMSVMNDKGFGKLAAQLMKELGNKAVNSAVESENWDAFNKLISLFVDLNLDLNKIDDDGNTLLHLAIINGQEKAIKNIAERNWTEGEPVKIDIQNNAGKTAKELIIEKYGQDYFRKLYF